MKDRLSSFQEKSLQRSKALDEKFARQTLLPFRRKAESAGKLQLLTQLDEDIEAFGEGRGVDCEMDHKWLQKPFENYLAERSALREKVAKAARAALPGYAKQLRALSGKLAREQNSEEAALVIKEYERSLNLFHLSNLELAARILSPLSIHDGKVRPRPEPGTLHIMGQRGERAGAAVLARQPRHQEAQDVICCRIGWKVKDWMALKKDGRILIGDASIEVPSSMKPAVAISVNECYAALHADGTVTFLGNAMRYPSGLKNVAKIEVGHGQSGIALHKDGTITYWQTPETDSTTVYTPPAHWLRGAVDVEVSGGVFYVLRDNGQLVGWSRTEASKGPARGKGALSLHATFGAVMFVDRQARAFVATREHHHRMELPSASAGLVEVRDGHMIRAGGDDTGVWHLVGGDKGFMIRDQFAQWRNQKVLKDLAVMADDVIHLEMMAWIE